MARKRPARIGNPDLRQQKHIPAPPIEEIEKQIFSLLSPASFKPLKSYEHKQEQEPEQKKKLRDRILTLPVMMAMVAPRTAAGIALNQPLDLISTEMVFRSLYHFSQAVLRGDASDAVPYLVEHQKLFGLVKTRRKRHREIDAYTEQIWALSS
jgi:hypothetical protein